MQSPTLRSTARLLAALGVLSARTALAFPSSRFVYSRDRGAERCPDEHIVRREVASRLGYDPFFPSADRVIIAEVAPSFKGGFRATVHLVDKAGIVRGKRELRSSGRDCTELLKSIALAISIAIDPDALEEYRTAPSTSEAPTGPNRSSKGVAGVGPPTGNPPLPEPLGREPPAPAPSSTEPAPQSAAAAEQDSAPIQFVHRDTSDGWNLVVGAGVRVATGVAPAAAAGGTVLVGGRWRWLTLSVEGTADLPASNDVVRSNLVTGSLAGCAQRGVVFGCFVGSIGALFARGQRSDSSAYAALGARLGAAIPFGRVLSLRGYLEATVPVGWSEIVLAVNHDEAWGLGAVGGAAGMQLVTLFP
jgi:hypothetical protein